MRTNFRALALLLFLICAHAGLVSGQRISRFTTDEMELIYFGKRYSYLMPHVASTFHNAMNFHKLLWNYDHDMTYVLLTDFEDDGHGGAMVMPVNLVILGISPFNHAFNIVPTNERFQWLSNHELTHIAMADNANKSDLFWRKAMLGKVRREEKYPLSAIWSYLTTPRWYAPRWYHEGIACYLETWMSGGLGRALGPYDEMYFRSIVNENQQIYSVVGLETEGTTIDFQVGANAYLYGSRFVTYLAQDRGMDKLKAFYNRTDDSKAFYARQFRKVYGQSVRHAWNDWIDFEQDFQQQNLSTIREFPQTAFRAVTPNPLGSVSGFGFHAQQNKIVAAINMPGAISQIAELDLNTGKTRKVATLDSPKLYTVTSLAYDAENDVAFISEQNSKFRSLVKVDMASGKKTTLIRFARTGSLFFNPADASIWGVRHDNGYASIVRIPKPYADILPMYTAEFGKTLFDLAISGDGKYLSATLTGVRGDQSLILFEIKDLEMGVKTFETLHALEDNTLSQFRFTDDNKYLIGTSYYTGVSNIWQISLEDRELQLLSNDDSGLFAPVQASEDSLIVLKFFRDGMQPGIIPREVITHANAIRYFGDLAIQNNPELEGYSLPAASRIDIDSLLIEEASYYPLKNMKLTNAYPDVAGYKESFALGYRLNFRDRVGISNLDMFLGGSPWSNYQDKQKFHGSLQWDFWYWSFSASYNKTDFYDLFGPTKRSRAGYSVGLRYKKSKALFTPFSSYYGIGLYHYGDLEVLPQYQNISTPIRNFQAFSLEAGVSKLRRSLGGVEHEMGYSWDVHGYGYYARGSLYPSLVSEQNLGWLVPGIRNTSFWIRNSLGQSFGKRGSSFSNFYFGGFRNNFVDWQPSAQYRQMMAFPGSEIDGIAAHNFIKTMGELNLKPIRFNNVGATWLYPTFLKTSLFGTHLLTDPDRKQASRNVFNAGAQLDLELVIFSYMKTTWSAGYARIFEAGHGPQQQWMFSLKLLGN